MSKLTITKHEPTRGNVTQYTLEATYVPNAYVGEVSKVIGTYTSFHEVWMKVKEVYEGGGV